VDRALEERRYLLETYFPRESRHRLPEIAARVGAAADAMRVDGTDVRYLLRIFVPEDETCFHLFAAPSAQAVSAVSKRAALDYDRIVEAVQ
jgi:hypothetical protein